MCIGHSITCNYARHTFGYHRFAIVTVRPPRMTHTPSKRIPLSLSGGGKQRGRQHTRARASAREGEGAQGRGWERERDGGGLGRQRGRGHTRERVWLYRGHDDVVAVELSRPLWHRRGCRVANREGGQARGEGSALSRRHVIGCEQLARLRENKQTGQ